ncbi:MAG: sensor histidine kinase [Bacteroidia bacterium]
MPNKARNIALWLALLFLLPAALLTYRELKSLNQFESTLGEMYQKQLDAVLYSVNQYSQDLAESWARNLELNGYPDSAFFQNAPSISQVIFADSIQDPSPRVFGPKTDINKTEAKAFFDQEKSRLKRLSGYLAANYRKLEPVSFQTIGENKQGILFFVSNANEPPKPCYAILDPSSFVGMDLRPRLEVLAQKDFNLFVWKDGQETPVCATDTVANIDTLGQKPLWLLPDHRVAISLRGENLSTLIKERSKGSLWLMLGLNMLVLLGVIWVYRSIRKEMQLAQTKSDFVSNVSHEIRTPLALISMFAETLMLKRVPNEARKDTYYRIIFQESKRLTGLVNKILNFSQMESGLRAYQFEKNDLNMLVKEVWEAYEFHLEQKGFSSNFGIHEGELLINADGEAISEALVNLLDNAMKYSLDTKHVSLQTDQDATHVWLEVKDQGMGIPQDQLEKIFDKFHRVASGPIHNTKGTGLGLTLVKSIMDAHEGSVEVQSEPDKGSSFRLVFNKLS